ncbi:hypothetical protein [Kutzneria chonburiensis]|uniref:Integral membrane protein n=1 Tax=Kutzneria chonburiensis TaxID=1483604 RepID=A0ABV6MRM2_9PSEU|nr:hypothetical protein [Kutzneria chonburiensis]
MQSTAVMRISWLCLAVVGVGILGFGLVVIVAPPASDAQLYRADGLASVGLGLFGLLLTVVPFRRRERWAWWVLWFYPILWLAHLVFALPPGTDHVHQVVFIVLSLVGLLLPAREFLR